MDFEKGSEWPTKRNGEVFEYIVERREERRPVHDMYMIEKKACGFWRCKVHKIWDLKVVHLMSDTSI